MDKDTMFTQNGCINCKLVEGALKRANKLSGITILNVSEDVEAMATALADYDILSYPCLVAKDGSVHRTVDDILTYLGAK